MMHEDDRDDADREVHGLLGSLRKHFFEVAHDFSERVSTELKRRRTEGPPTDFLGMVGSILLETTNLVTSWAAAPGTNGAPVPKRMNDDPEGSGSDDNG